MTLTPPCRSDHLAALRCIDEQKMAIAEALREELAAHGLHGIAGEMGLAIHRIGETCLRDDHVRLQDLECSGPLSCSLSPFLSISGGGGTGVTLTPLGQRIYAVAQGLLAKTLDTLPPRDQLNCGDFSCIHRAVTLTETFWTQQRVH